MSTPAGGYYCPDPSPWPLVASITIFMTVFGVALWINDVTIGKWMFAIGAAGVIFMMFGWWNAVIRESTSGLYNDDVDLSFRMTMGWFIFSEVMFFCAFFGALFYARILSVPWLEETTLLWGDYTGGWPTAGPAGATHMGADVHDGVPAGKFSTIGAWGIPLYNTIILMVSSLTVTIAHHALRANQRGKLIFWLAVTVALGALFMYFQVAEYIEAYSHLGLTLGTGVYGATFFMLTGFHGMHVTIGAIILFFVLIRCIRGAFTPENHFAFEAAAWYWHFVDTVWVGLFIFVYIL